MASCPKCGFEVFGEVCPACGTEIPRTVTRSSSFASRRDKTARRERFQPPPAPKDQPALLHDASPVFSPVYYKPDAADVMPELNVSDEQSADEMQSNLQEDTPAEPEQQDTEELQKARCESQPEIEQLIVTETEQLPEEPLYDIQAEQPEQTAYIIDDTEDSDDSVFSEPEETAETEVLAVQTDIQEPEPEESGSEWMPASLVAANTLFRCMLRGEFERAAELVTAKHAVSCWQWLLPLHIFGGSVSAATLGNNIEGLEIFSRFGSALGAGAIIWCEHFVVFLLLMSLLFSLTGCRMRPLRVIETACAAVTPLMVFSALAGAFAGVSVPVGFSFLIFGAIMSAMCVFSFAGAAGVFRAKHGRMLTGIVVLADIIFASLLINSII